jgi:microcystin-dependent protein
MSQTQVQSGFIGDNSVTTAKLDSSIVGALVPIGGIIMWSGSVETIPSSWALCNGANGTPNLQDKFLVGAGSGYAVGATGGSANATLVSHSHTATSTVSDPGHQHQWGVDDNIGAQGGNGNPDSNPGNVYNGRVTTRNTTDITVSTSISTEGSSATNANLPPYYALAFIMRVS